MPVLNSSKNDLQKLIHRSQTLSPGNKEILLRQANHFNSDQIQQLKNVFLDEKTRLQSIDEKYTVKGQKLLVQYLKIIAEFEHVVIPKTLKKIEGMARNKEETTLQTIIDAANAENLTSPKKTTAAPPKITPHKPFIFLALAGILVTCGLLYYFLFLK